MQEVSVQMAEWEEIFAISKTDKQLKLRSIEFRKPTLKKHCKF